MWRAALLLSTCLVACGASSSTASTPEPPSLRTACPLGVADTRIRVDETEYGLDLLFTTARPSLVDELRMRVRDQTTPNGPGRHAGHGHDGEHSSGHDHGLRLWAVGDVRTAVTDMPAGARISIVALDPQRKREVRETVVKRVARLEAKGCPG